MGRRYKNEPSTFLNCQDRIRQLGKLYTFRDASEVEQFLEERSFLIPLLFEAYAQIGNYFGPSPPASLQVVTDPEADDDRELYAFVATRLPVEEALARLEQFDEQWWLAAVVRAQGNLCIDVEFV